MFALCCHHVCNFTHYCNHNFLNASEINELEFRIIATLSSWATNGPPVSRSKDQENHLSREEVDQGHWSGISEWKDRATIGSMCKAILDFGRAAFLKDLGFDSQLYYYCPKSTSLENVVLVAKRIEK